MNGNTTLIPYTYYLGEKFDLLMENSPCLDQIECLITNYSSPTKSTLFLVNLTTCHNRLHALIAVFILSSKKVCKQKKTCSVAAC